MSKSLSGLVALVSGSSRGIGAAIAVELAARGAAVAVNYCHSRDRAATVVKQITTAGGKAAAFGADVCDEAQVKKLVDSVGRELGPVDILVINATGPQPLVPIEQMNWRTCLDQLEFFVKSPLLLTQAVLGHMKKKRRGRIIQIGSEVFDTGFATFSSYVSAKAAQLGLTRSWGLELAPHGITVNLVAPGWVPTDRHADIPQKDKDRHATTIPVGRLGTAQEIGQAVAFLASDDAAFITGQKLSVNGGHTLG